MSRRLGRDRRRAVTTAAASALDDMLAGATDDAIALERGLPRAAIAGIRSFYDQLGHTPRATLVGPRSCVPETRVDAVTREVVDHGSRCRGHTSRRARVRRGA